MWGLKRLNINSLFGGQTLASIILSLEVDHHRLAGQVLILLVIRINLESYQAPDGTCLGFLLFIVPELADTHCNLNPHNWAVKGRS